MDGNVTVGSILWPFVCTSSNSTISSVVSVPYDRSFSYFFFISSSTIFIHPPSFVQELNISIFCCIHQTCPAMAPLDGAQCQLAYLVYHSLMLCISVWNGNLVCAHYQAVIFTIPMRFNSFRTLFLGESTLHLPNASCSRPKAHFPEFFHSRFFGGFSFALPKSPP